jgi:hypothetical protein
MSTSFLVIQAQRDLAQAKTNEVGAILAYDLSLVDFEALQQAGPPGADSNSNGRNGSNGSGTGANGAALSTVGAAALGGVPAVTGSTTNRAGGVLLPGVPQVQQ